MKANYILSTSLLGLLVASCYNEKTLPLNNNVGEQNRIIIVQERNPNLPRQSVNKPVVVEDYDSTKATTRNGAIIGNSDALLGYSYSVGNSILGDYSNVRHSVINIERVKEYGADYITAKAPQYFSTERFSCSNYDSYESKLSETKKIATGASLNLGLFKLGRKKTTETTFNSAITASSHVVYGELNMLYYNSTFELVSASRKLYARECLSSTFVRNLYSATIGDILDTYGEYILTGYITGGKAFALFAGISNEESSAESNERNMNTNIDASISWKDKSASGSCSFGTGSGNTSSTTTGFSNIQTKLWIYGGNPAGLTMNSANDLNNINLDLNTWVESLNNINTHTIVDLTENGIYPLSEFILEENFKRRIDATTIGALPKYPSFVTPYIDVMRVFERYSSTTGEALYDIAAVLTTRQGDKIVLRTGDAESASDEELKNNENASVFNLKANAIAQAKQDFYDLTIRINSSTRLNPIMGTPLCIDLGRIDESSMYVYSNPRTGIQYIYDRTNRIAFSYLVDDLDGDWILDEYGIRDWVESLAIKSISLATIANSYKIVGL